MTAAATQAYTSVGSSMFISATLPATQDSAGYTAVTGASWIEIGELDSIGEYGPKSDTTSRTPLKKNVTQKYKGARNFGSCALAMGYAPGDPGQALLKTAEATSATYAFKVVDSSGSTDYFTGLVMDYTKTVGAAGDYTKGASNIELNSSIVTV